jgi:hypothetical protein
MAGYADRLLGGDTATVAPPVMAGEVADASQVGPQAARPRMFTMADAGAPEQTAQAPSTSYADRLLSAPATRAPAPSVSLKDLPIVNADARATDKSTADFSTMAKAAMVEDPKTRLRIFAKARFPNDPNAVSRYGMVDGEPVYVGDDQRLYRETPEGFGNWAKGAGAGLVGHAPSIVGGAIGAGQGALAGAPFGPPGAIAGGLAGAALGAAGGRGYEKVGANLAFGEPQTAAGNAKDMATEAAWSAGGTALGLGFARHLEKSRLAKDIGKLDEPGMSALSAKANAVGIELNPAQATNLPSLKSKYDVLASLPKSRETIAEGARKQSTQAYDAADRLIKGISATDGLDEAGELAREGAKKVIASLAQERADAARPLYVQAFEKFDQYRQGLTTANPGGQAARVVPEVSRLMDRPAMKEAEKQAVKLAANDGVTLKNPTQSLLGLHYVKLALDDAIEGATNPRGGLGASNLRSLTELKGQFVGILDNLSPDYAEARKVFAHFSPTISAVKQGMVSRVAGLSDDHLMRTADMMFSGSNVSPKGVAQARQLFAKAGLEEEWNALLAARLRDTFEKAGKQPVAGITPGGAVTQAPKWAASMMGPREYRVMEKAMSPEQFQGFKDLLEVFNAIGRTAYAGAGSQTMPRQEAAKAMRDEMGSTLGKVAGSLEVWKYLPRLKAWADEARFGQNSAKLAEVMTSPGGLEQLRELRRLQPDSMQFIARASALFGISLAPSAGTAETTMPARPYQPR